jgi:16S rRNA (guanine527-N7)-methyltransferase
MSAAIAAAAPRATHQLIVLAANLPALPQDFSAEPGIPMPNSGASILLRASRAI